MFQGYTQETVDFMWGIRFNNERSWFLPRKEVYQRALLQPTRDLAEQVYTAVQGMLPDEPLLVKVSRIYRDARRLHGNGPYKDHLWFCIRTGDQDWTNRPTFWFEIAPDYYSYGLGFCRPKASLMAHYRRQIDAHPAELEKLVRDFAGQEVFTLSGDVYARPKGQVSALLQPWYDRKSITLRHECSPLDERIFSPALADDLIHGFGLLTPFYRYFAALCRSLPE